MNRAFNATLTALLVVLPGSFAVLADSHEHDMGLMDHSAHRGASMHNSMVDGHPLPYHLIDLREKLKDMENMPEMKATHHMMVYVVGPDGRQQKLMAMGTSGGFGVDVDFGAPGAYTVKTKAVANGTTLLDEFTHEVN